MRSDSRPVFLNLFRLHLPITGWVSILHRLSGALLFVLLPWGVWAFGLSLASEAGYARVRTVVTAPYVKTLLLAVVAAFVLHFFAGLRHLLMDAHLAMRLRAARVSSTIVLLASGLVVALAAWALFK